MKHKAGFVSIVGKPNVGKSTLLNQLLGYKLSIVTYKAQTTRQRILGILNKPDYQIVFLDTPGYLKPQYELHKVMVRKVHEALKDADVILYVAALRERFDEQPLWERLSQITATPIILALNKVDLARNNEEVQKRIEQIRKAVPTIKEVIAIAALHGFQLDRLEATLVKYLPENPPYYPKDQLTDRPERFFVAECIREKIFLFLEEELPYASLVEVVYFKDRGDLIYIEAYIHVEKKSQKPIVIGKNGRMLTKIGKAARIELEKMLGKKVFLKLRVKVNPNWSDNPQKLRYLGYY